MHVTFSVAFFSKHAKTQTSNFRIVVQQYIEDMVGSIMWILLEIYFFSNSERILKIH